VIEANPPPAAKALGARTPEGLCAAYEAREAAGKGRLGRKASGLYYTPPEIAARVLSLALAHGPSVGTRPRVLDPCAGAGQFLLAAARALPGAELYASDLDRAALQLAAQVVSWSERAERSWTAARELRAAVLDALWAAPVAGESDLVVSNPPYGLVSSAERARLVGRFPALAGGEVDRYAAFLLRALELVRPGGCVALLIPDTWMTNARQRRLREEVLRRARLCAVADLGKPFAAARDTRVQCVVLERRLVAQPPVSSKPGTGAGSGSATESKSASVSAPVSASAPASEPAIFAARLVGGALEPLAPIAWADLRARAASGWQPYRSQAEKRFCAALEAVSVPLEKVCEVGYGLRTGDNAGHVSRKASSADGCPLCGGEDVVPFALRWREKRLVHATPRLSRLAEAQLGRPRIAIQRIRTNSSEPWARWLEAAPVAPGMVCLDSLSTLATPEHELLWALLGLCNSVALNRWHRLRTTDVNVKPSALRELPVPRALLSPVLRGPLAALSRRRAAEVEAELAREAMRGEAGKERSWRRRATASGGLAPATERAIDREVYRLFGLGPEEIGVAARGHWGGRADTEIGRLRLRRSEP
jgi:tRNA1(Val) A37 N6-methylase TrmN6